jgi:hypothetical protein
VKVNDRSEKFISFCNYKLGLCWMGISSESRNKALTQKNKANNSQGFTRALEALNTAIDYTKKMKGDLGGPLSNLIKHYNLACCYSMRAQYKVEDKIDLNEDQIAELRNATDFTSAKKVWEDIGKNWRNDDKRTDIDIEAQKALKELQEIFSLSSSENSLDSIDLPINPDLLPDRIWLVEAALKDEDLIFLHTDEKKWQPEFNKWTEGALLGNKSITDTV